MALLVISGLICVTLLSWELMASITCLVVGFLLAGASRIVGPHVFYPPESEPEFIHMVVVTGFPRPARVEAVRLLEI